MHWAAILVWLQGPCLGLAGHPEQGFGLFGFGFALHGAARAPSRSRSSGTHPPG